MTTAERTAHTVAVADHTHHHADRPEHHVEPDSPRKSWAVLAVALTAQILVVLDISVVNTALPSIGRSLNLRSGDLQWLVTAYLMMSGGGLLLGGRIADLLSRRRVFLKRRRRRPGVQVAHLNTRTRGSDAVMADGTARTPGPPRHPVAVA
jgi:hypothetical protein